MKVAVYVREKSGQIATSKRILESKVRSFGWHILRTYVDENTDGMSLGRNGLKHMMLDAEKGMFDIIVVSGIEKLSRKVLDLKNITYLLDKYKVNIIELGGKIEQR